MFYYSLIVLLYECENLLKYNWTVFMIPLCYIFFNKKELYDRIMLYIIQHACCNHHKYFIKADSGTEAAEIFVIEYRTPNENGYFGIMSELALMHRCFDIVALLVTRRIAPGNNVVGKHSWSRGSIVGIEPNFTSR